MAAGMDCASPVTAASGAYPTLLGARRPKLEGLSAKGTAARAADGEELREEPAPEKSAAASLVDGEAPPEEGAPATHTKGPATERSEAASAGPGEPQVEEDLREEPASEKSTTASDVDGEAQVEEGVLAAQAPQVAKEDLQEEPAPEQSEADVAEAEAEWEALKQKLAKEKLARESELFWKAAQQALHERERRERVGAFLKEHGYSGVNSRKGWMWNYNYPLHRAAELGDLSTVQFLLESGAVRRQRDFDGRTARQVAKERNELGSHDEVIKVLTKKKQKCPEPVKRARKFAEAAAPKLAQAGTPAAKAAAVGASRVSLPPGPAALISIIGKQHA